MHDETAHIHFWERVEALREPAQSFRSLVEAAGMRFDVALVMRRQNTIPAVQQVCAMARELGVSVDWLLASEVGEALEQINSLEDGLHARVRALALKILKSPPEVLERVEKTLELDQA